MRYRNRHTLLYRGFRLDGELCRYDDVGDSARARQGGRCWQRVVYDDRVLFAHAYCSRQADDGQCRRLDGAESHFVELILTCLLIQERHLPCTCV